MTNKNKVVDQKMQQELHETLSDNWDQTIELTREIYGDPEDIVKEYNLNKWSPEALEYTLRERENFFKETLRFLNDLHLQHI